jgi:hypothetical protein
VLGNKLVPLAIVVLVSSAVPVQAEVVAQAEVPVRR